jgi:uncharacterized iron-regulated membrane protein
VGPLVVPGGLYTRLADLIEHDPERVIYLALQLQQVFDAVQRLNADSSVKVRLTGRQPGLQIPDLFVAPHSTVGCSEAEAPRLRTGLETVQKPEHFLADFDAFITCLHHDLAVGSTWRYFIPEITADVLEYIYVVFALVVSFGCALFAVADLFA